MESRAVVRHRAVEGALTEGGDEVIVDAGKRSLVGVASVHVVLVKALITEAHEIWDVRPTRIDLGKFL